MLSIFRLAATNPTGATVEGGNSHRHSFGGSRGLIEQRRVRHVHSGQIGHLLSDRVGCIYSTAQARRDTHNNNNAATMLTDELDFLAGPNRLHSTNQRDNGGETHKSIV